MLNSNSIKVGNIFNFTGDSITAIPNAYGGLTNAQIYPSIVMANLGMSSLLNDTAQTGFTIDSLMDYDHIHADPLVDITKLNILSVFAGTNDLGQEGDSTVELANDLMDYVHRRKLYGWDKVIVATILPRNDSADVDFPNFETDRQAFNTWLRANWMNFAEGLVDIGADAIMGNVSNINNTTYYLDGVHPTALGHTILAPYFEAAIRAIL